MCSNNKIKIILISQYTYIHTVVLYMCIVPHFKQDNRYVTIYCNIYQRLVGTLDDPDVW